MPPLLGLILLAWTGKFFYQIYSGMPATRSISGLILSAIVAFFVCATVAVVGGLVALDWALNTLCEWSRYSDYPY